MIAIPLTFLLLAPFATRGGPNDPPAPADEGASVVRTYDLGAIEVRGAQDGWLGLLPYLQPDRGDGAGDLTSWLEPDVVLDLVTRAFPEQFDYAERVMWTNDDGQVFVRAPQALHERVARFLADLERVASAHAVLRVDVLTLPSTRVGNAGTSGVVSSAEAAELRGLAGASRRTHRVDVYPGRIAEVELRRRHELVLDYDVEVAQGAFVHDPVVRTVAVGTHALLRAAPARGGIELAFAFQRAAPQGGVLDQRVRARGFVSGESFQEFVPAAEGYQSLEVVERSLAGNAFLADGRALVYRSDLALGSAADGQAGTTELVIVERESGELPTLVTAGEGSERPLRILNRESIEPPRCSIEEWPERSEPLDAIEREGEVSLIPVQVASGDDDRPRALLESSSTGLWLEDYGPWIFASEDPDAMNEIHESGGSVTSLEDALAAEQSEPEMIELALSVRRGANASDRPVRCVLPLRVGREGAAVLGRERFVLSDADVEIAQNAATADMVTRVQFDGLYLRARPHRGAGGELVLELRGQAHLLRERGRFELQSPLLDAIDESSFDQLVFDERLVLSGNGPQSFVRNEFAGGGEDPALALEITVRALPR